MKKTKNYFIATFAAIVLGFGFWAMQSSTPGQSRVPTTVQVHKGTAFDSTTTTDTTAVQRIDEAYYITYSAYYTGGTSSTFTVYVLGNIGGNYIPIDDFTVTTNAYTDQILRTKDLDSLGAVNQIKFATTMTIGDSLGTGDLNYYANYQLR